MQNGSLFGTALFRGGAVDADARRYSHQFLEWRTHRKDANVLISGWIQLGSAKLFLSQSPEASQSSWSNLEERASSSLLGFQKAEPRLLTGQNSI